MDTNGSKTRGTLDLTAFPKLAVVTILLVGTRSLSKMDGSVKTHDTTLDITASAGRKLPFYPSIPIGAAYPDGVGAGFYVSGSLVWTKLRVQAR